MKCNNCDGPLNPKLSWQDVPGMGNLCNPCHDEWLGPVCMVDGCGKPKRSHTPNCETCDEGEDLDNP